MWLMTQHGFYSIVQKGRDEFHVRARTRAHIGNALKLLAPHLSPSRIRDIQIETWPRADYRYRLILHRREVDHLVKAITLRLTYANFKSRVAQVDGAIIWQPCTTCGGSCLIFSLTRMVWAYDLKKRNTNSIRS